MDARETELVMEYLVTGWKGPAYIRLTRQNLPDLYPSGAKFEPLKLLRLRGEASGASVVLVGTGAGTAEAVGAAEQLAAQGVSCAVWNALTLKPFDDAGLLAAARGAKLVVTVEDHTVIGGLGSCVAEALAGAGAAVPLLRLGVQDQFGESGEPAELYDKFGISAKAVAERTLARLRA
jgi:transketolase